ncbi:class I SAM-dependent methyltransferase [Marinilabiliaceae bacterium JC017]|nr:class I SAM-dependent methyltransferase [Marinilabiliaceae bacterium JC017]
MKEMWDDRYANDQFLYGFLPNHFFETFIQGLEPGKLLLPGEGEGRHAVFAARKGWQVTAVDYSAVGRRKALMLADQYNVVVDYQIADLATYVPQTEVYDAIALVFVHMPSEQRALVHQQMISGLKPGGRLFLIGFTRAQLQYSSGGPKDEDWLFSSEALEKEFSGLNIIRNEELITVFNESQGHQGEGAVVVFEAVKPR